MIKLCSGKIRMWESNVNRVAMSVVGENIIWCGMVNSRCKIIRENKCGREDVWCTVNCVMNGRRKKLVWRKKKEVSSTESKSRL